MEEQEHPLWEAILKEGKKGKTDPSEYAHLMAGRTPKFLLAFKMLRGAGRKYVIERVKAPLRKALVTGKTLSQVIKTLKLITSRLPEPTPENCGFLKTHLLMKIEDKFFQYENNLGREEMFRAVIKLLKAEIEHDGYYQARYDFWLEEHIKMILTGEWLPRVENSPDICWREPTPYGGKHTIVHAIQKNKDKIIDLLGEEWQWLKSNSYEKART